MTTIPVKSAEFFWNADRDTGRMPTEFVITDKEARLAETRRTGHDAYRHLRSSLGAHVANWMDGSSLQTPEAMFARIFLTRLSPLDRVPIHSALMQFANIEGQDWAVRMLAAVDRYTEELRPLPDNDDSGDQAF